MAGAATVVLTEASAESRRAVGALAWALFEDLALTAGRDDHGRLVAEASARGVAERLGLGKNRAATTLARLRYLGWVAVAAPRQEPRLGAADGPPAAVVTTSPQQGHGRRDRPAVSARGRDSPQRSLFDAVPDPEPPSLEPSSSPPETNATPFLPAPTPSPAELPTTLPLMTPDRTDALAPGVPTWPLSGSGHLNGNGPLC